MLVAPERTFYPCPQGVTIRTFRKCISWLFQAQTEIYSTVGNYWMNFRVWIRNALHSTTWNQGELNIGTLSRLICLLSLHVPCVKRRGIWNLIVIGNGMSGKHEEHKLKASHHLVHVLVSTQVCVTLIKCLQLSQVPTWHEIGGKI